MVSASFPTQRDFCHQKVLNYLEICYDLEMAPFRTNMCCLSLDTHIHIHFS